MTTTTQLLEKWEARSRDALPSDAMLINKHIRELRDALAAELAGLKAQEPVASRTLVHRQSGKAYWSYLDGAKDISILDRQPLYAAPKALAPLTDEQMRKLYCHSALKDRIVVRSDWEQGVRDGEAAHGIGGTP